MQVYTCLEWEMLFFFFFFYFSKRDRNVLNTAREESTCRDKILSCSALKDGQRHCCKPAWCDLVVELPHPEASSNHFNTCTQRQRFECWRKEIFNCKQPQQYKLILQSLVKYVTWKDSNSFYYCCCSKGIGFWFLSDRHRWPCESNTIRADGIKGKKIQINP